MVAGIDVVRSCLEGRHPEAPAGQGPHKRAGNGGLAHATGGAGHDQDPHPRPQGQNSIPGWPLTL